jgi:hypothetical protein
MGKQCQQWVKVEKAEITGLSREKRGGMQKQVENSQEKLISLCGRRAKKRKVEDQEFGGPVGPVILLVFVAGPDILGNTETK